MKYYRLVDKIIISQVPDTKGIYFLGDVQDGTFVVGYVGRSDASIRERLLSHELKEQFEYFSFESTRTKRDAFLLETEYYYLYRDSIVNKIHPDLPSGLLMEHPCDTLGKAMKKRWY